MNRSRLLAFALFAIGMLLLLRLVSYLAAVPPPPAPATVAALPMATPIGVPSHMPSHMPSRIPAPTRAPVPDAPTAASSATAKPPLTVAATDGTADTTPLPSAITPSLLPAPTTSPTAATASPLPSATTSSATATASPLPSATSPPATPTSAASSAAARIVNNAVDPPWWPCLRGETKGLLKLAYYYAPDHPAYNRVYVGVVCFANPAAAQGAGLSEAPR